MEGNSHHQSNAICPIQGCDSGSTVVQTSWALLALMAGDCKEIDVFLGQEFLMKLFFQRQAKHYENFGHSVSLPVGFRSHSTRNQSALAAPTPFWRLGTGEYCRSVRDPGQWK